MESRNFSGHPCIGASRVHLCIFATVQLCCVPVAPAVSDRVPVVTGGPVGPGGVGKSLSPGDLGCLIPTSSKSER